MPTRAAARQKVDKLISDMIANSAPAVAHDRDPVTGHIRGVLCPEGCVDLFVESGGCQVLGTGNTGKIRSALPAGPACQEMGKIDTCAEDAFAKCNILMPKVSPHPAYMSKAYVYAFFALTLGHAARTRTHARIFCPGTRLRWSTVSP